MKKLRNAGTVVLFFILNLSYFSLFSQKATVSGIITDDKKEPLIGATISIDKTTKATITDIDGKYKLEINDPGKYTLVFSYVGYVSQKKELSVSSGQSLNIDIVLKEDILNLEEVVVVGYGRRQKRDITGSIETIKAKDIEDAVVPSFDQAIQGRASGVQVTAANGVAGAPVKVNIRGNSSISAGGEPLYVIDGIPMITGDYSPDNLGAKTNALSDINPNDIESIEVLKDAAAAAIYGSRGSNGVIIITTKKGKEGKTKFNVGYYVGSTEPTNKLKLLSASEMLSLRDKGLKELYNYDTAQAGYNYRKDPEHNVKPGKTVFTGDSASTVIPGNVTRAKANQIASEGGTDWIDKTIRKGMIEEMNVSAQGGTDKTTYYIAGTYHKENGFLVGNNFDRINGRINIENNATKTLKIGTNTGIAYTKNVRVPIGDAGGLGLAQQKFPYAPIYNDDGSFNQPSSNPLWQLDNMHFNAQIFRVVSSIYADLTILPEIKTKSGNTYDLKFRSEFGMDMLNQYEEEFDFRNTQDSTSTSSAWDRATRVIDYTTNQYFTSNWKINDIHNFNFTLGYAYQNSLTKGFGLNGYNFSNDFYTSPGNATSGNQGGYAYQTGYAFVSYFFRMNYKLKEKYLAGISIRDDGSSRFGPDNHYGWFPAFSAGWILSEESFIKNIKPISFLKLRASYGFTGNANIGDFAYLGLYNTSNGYDGESGVVPGNLPNPKLGWEKARQTDITLDYGVLNNRISGTFTYYYKKTTDMLLYVSIPTSSGFGSILENVGKMENHGFEITLSTKNIDKKLKWSTDFNIAFNRNKVLDVDNLPPDAFESGEPGEGRVILGYPVGQAYVVKFAGIAQQDEVIPVYDANGNKTSATYQIHAGQELFYDKFGNLMSGDKSNTNFYDNRVPMGNPNPDFVGGITNNFSYKGFDLNFLFVFVSGNTLYDDPAKNQIGAWTSVAQRREILDAWTPENHSNTVPALAYTPANGDYPARNSSRFLYDASFIRLRSLSFGYSFPPAVCKRMHLETLRIYLLGSNLLTFTKYPGWDPEVLRNVNPNSQQGNISFAGPSLQTPQTKTYSIGINVGF